MQGLHTPLQARGVPHLCIDQSAPYRTSCKKQNWDVVFGTKSRAKLPDEALVKEFVGKTPVSTRPSICATVALVHLHRGNHWSDAQHLWQGVALLPHRLVRDEQSVYLILAQGRWAARAWVATPLESPSPGLQEPLSKKWSFCTNMCWRWLFVRDIKDWFYIPHVWVENSIDVNINHCMAAEEINGGTGTVPLLAEALVVQGHRSMNRLDRIYFHHEFGISTNLLATVQQLKGGDETLMHKLLEGHRASTLGQYMNRLEAWHKHEAAKSARRRRRARNSPNPGDSSTDSGEESEVGPQCALTVAALQDMDEVNARDYRQLKKTGRLAGVKGHVHAAKRILDAEREQRHPRPYTNLR